MAVRDPANCAESQAGAHHLEDQTSQPTHREIQKSMQSPTANTANRNPMALLAVPDPVPSGDLKPFADTQEGCSTRDYRVAFNERAGIAEFAGGLPTDRAARAYACCIKRVVNP
jgi:hypothetical protein